MRTILAEETFRFKNSTSRDEDWRQRRPFKSPCRLVQKTTAQGGLEYIAVCSGDITNLRVFLMLCALKIVLFEHTMMASRYVFPENLNLQKETKDV